jgi:putative acetyltransferase
MLIRETADTDIDNVFLVEKMAFGQEEEAKLVLDLLNDPTARPLCSLLAVDKETAIGHILFTAARLQGSRADLWISILAPLAVIPEYQNQGVGGALIRHGLQNLQDAGVDLVFVLGHPGYYPHYGFKPAGELGFEASYPIPPENAEAWMVQELRPGVIGSVSGKVRCADMLDKPEYWQA